MMTVQELIDALRKLPPKLEVWQEADGRILPSALPEVESVDGRIPPVNLRLVIQA